MTRAERRRRRQRARRIRIGVVSVTLAITLFCLCFAMAGVADERSPEKVTVSARVSPATMHPAQTQAVVETLSVETEPEARSVEPTQTPKAAESTAEIPQESDDPTPEEQDFYCEEIPLDRDLQEKARGWCEEYEVPYSLVLAVIEQESHFQADAYSTNCYGLMQINSINSVWLNEQIEVVNLYDPEQNIHSGIFILADLYEKYEDWTKVLICYNYGESGAQKYVFSQGYTSTSYSRSVQDLQAKWEEVVG